MKYTLITPQGKVYTFFLHSVAEMYQRAYGGSVIVPEQFERVFAPELTD
jgi:hypothetical protein